MARGLALEPELIFTVVVFRVLLMLLCCETAWRYFRWYQVTRRERDTSILWELMLGIAIVQAGFLTFTIYGLLFGRVPRHGLALAVYFFGDAFVTAGTIMHLRPAWRMASRPRVSASVLWRSAAASLVAIFLLWFDLQ